MLAALIGLVPFLLLLVLAYNDKSLRLEDQVVGTLIVVVLPGFLAAVLVATATAFAARLTTSRSGGERSGGQRPARA